jgi:hypothetical protein
MWKLFYCRNQFFAKHENELLQNFLRLQIFCSNLFAIMCIRKSILNKICNVVGGGGWGVNSAAANQPFWCWVEKSW